MIYRPSSLITVSSSSFTGNESRYLLDCISHNWITQGRYVQQFEERFAEWSGRKHAIACSSGTAALHLALIASQRITAVVPAMTYIATANAARHCGMDVQFVDVDRETWCLGHVGIPRLYDTSYESIVIPVDLFDARARNLSSCFTIVQDSCHSYLHGSCSLFSVISFYGSKLITTGEGGMVLTDDADLARQVRLYRGQGATIPGDYHHCVIGYNYRMTDLQAAVGLAQLERIDEFITYRRMIIDRYRSNLHDDDRFTLQGGVRANGWMFALLLPKHYGNVEWTRKLLRERNIETRPFFRPLPSLPPYYEDDYEQRYSVSCELYRRGLCLPTHVNLSVDDVDYVCEMLKEAVK